MPTQPRFSPAVAELLAHNRAFAAQRVKPEPPLPGKPAKHVAVVSCMDTRLTRMLPDALGLADGDAVIIKAAGATVANPYGEVMRSLLVAVGELDVTDILVVGHTACGTCGMKAEHLRGLLAQAGTKPEGFAQAARENPQLDAFLTGFSRLEDEVAASVAKIRAHPLMPASVRVYGFTIDIETGALTTVGD